ncbi:sulfur carrier protein ThiS [Peristeroidobacter soli]|jgi:sulfur carrier protein|uniref:sulfur carrier protein ThiS n=1 Tax=Peristeroidobacter soli TaxID=2497877 RepID=UPI00101D0ABB|nr:sulfur carrier protein ThiS [Peristeroidobacter soli]
MKITLNGVEREIAESRLEQALRELGYCDGPIATAVNGQFVPKKQRLEIALNEGDRIEVVAPMQGG